MIYCGPNIIGEAVRNPTSRFVSILSAIGRAYFGTNRVDDAWRTEGLCTDSLTRPIRDFVFWLELGLNLVFLRVRKGC